MKTYRGYRVHVEYDPEPHHALHDPEGEPLPGSPETYAESPISECIAHGRGCLDPSCDRRDVPYAEYCEYWGDPDRHVVLGVRVERLCPCCGVYSEIGAVWGIDCMDDAPEADAVGESFTDCVPPGYLGDVAREIIEDSEGDHS